MKDFLTGLREVWNTPPPRGTKRAGAFLGLILGWVFVGAAAG
jgi:hypothetical protein